MKTRLKTRFRGLSARKTELQRGLGKNQGLICKNRKNPRAKALKQPAGLRVLIFRRSGAETQKEGPEHKYF